MPEVTNNYTPDQKEKINDTLEWWLNDRTSLLQSCGPAYGEVKEVPNNLKDNILVLYNEARFYLSVITNTNVAIGWVYAKYTQMGNYEYHYFPEGSIPVIDQNIEEQVKVEVTQENGELAVIAAM